MKFKFCPDCGKKLSHRDLGDEMQVPWCDECDKPWFPVFPVAIIALVYNDDGEVLLLRQNYISTQFHNLVSGYIVPGEDAETCAVREIWEETGLKVDRLRLVLTSWFDAKEILMIGFFAHTLQKKLTLSSEVDDAQWMAADKILDYLSKRTGSASRRLATAFIEQMNDNSLPN
ncbi:MAG: NUDIX domain-containing protein [Muribaculaceae bacterium]|nr:NUDIX domain-containing protein [Muribaculaceae bacterium]